MSTVQGLTIKIDGDVRGFSSAIRTLNKPVNNLQRELKDIDRALKFNPGNSELAAQKMTILQKRTEELSHKLEILKEAKKEADLHLAKGEISDEEYRALNREVVKVTDQLKKAEEAVSRFAAESTNIAKLAEKMGEVGEKVSGTGKAIEGIGNKLMPVTAAVTGIGVASAKVAIDFLKIRESANIAFTTLLGSGEAATAMMDELYSFAKTTPFPYTTYLQAGQSMVAMGIDAKSVIPYLEAITDAAVGAGGSAAEIDRLSDAFGKIASRGKVTMNELNLITQAGIPAVKILSNQYNVTTDEMMELIRTGKLMADDVLPRLVDGMNNGTNGAAGLTAAYGGLANKMKGTLAGSVDSLKSKFRNMSIEMWNAEEAYPELINLINSFSGSLDALPKVFKAVSLSAGPTLKKMSDGLKGFSEWLGKADEKQLKMVGNIILLTAAAGPVLKIGGKAVSLTGDLMKGFSKVSKALMENTTVASAMASAFTKVSSTTYAAGTTIGGLGRTLSTVAPMIAAAGVLIGMLYHEYKKWEEETRSIYTVADREQIVADAISNAHKQISESSKQVMEAFTKQKNLLLADIAIMQEEGGAAANSFVERFAAMSEGIKKSIDDTVSGAQEAYMEIFLSDDVIDEEETRILTAMAMHGNQQKEKVDSIQKEITNIFRTQMDENGRLTEEGFARINELTAQMQASQLQVITDNQVEQKALTSRLEDEKTKMTIEKANERLEEVKRTNEDATKSIYENYEKQIAYAEIFKETNSALYEDLVSNAEKYKTENLKAIEEASQGQLKLIKEGLENAKKETDQKYAELMASGDRYKTQQDRALVEHRESLGRSIKQVENTLNDSKAAQEKNLSGTETSYGEAGTNAGSTFSSNLKAQAPAAEAAGRSLGKAAKYGLHSELGIKSPSRVAMKAADYVGKGFAIGLKRQEEKIQISGEDLAKAMLRGLNKRINSDTKLIAEKVSDILVKEEKRLANELEGMRIKAEKEAADKELKEYQKKVKELTAKKVKAKKSEQTKIQEEITKLNEDWNYKQLDKERKLREEEIRLEQQTLSEKKKIIEQYQKDVEGVQRSIDSYASNLARADLFSITTTKSGKEIFNLTNLEKDVKKLSQLSIQMDKLAEKKLPTGLLEEIKNMNPDDALRYTRALIGMTEEEIAKYIATWEELQETSRAIATNFYKSELETLDSEFLSKLPDEVDEVRDDMRESGTNLVNAMIEGMLSRESALIAVAKRLAKAASASTKAGLEIRSPSKVGRSIGQNYGDSIALGIMDEYGAVESAALALARAAEMKESLAYSVSRIDQRRQSESMSQITGLINALATMQMSEGGGGSMTVQIPIYLDGKQIALAAYDHAKNEKIRRGE
ncbi:MAG: tape measure protein [Anaerovoracaceae bacterium]|jgi:tape measure domain-containing protein